MPTALQPTSTSPLLHVERLSIWKIPGVRKIAEKWKELAAQKEKDAKQQWFSNVSSFSNCSWICKKLGEILSIFSSREVYVCRDASYKLQGILTAQVEESRLYIEYLTTHPNNIRSRINLEGIRGVGTALVKAVEDRARELGKSFVYLDPLSEAKGFYKKLGYEPLGTHHLMKRVDGVAQAALAA